MKWRPGDEVSSGGGTWRVTARVQVEGAWLYELQPVDLRAHESVARREHLGLNGPTRRPGSRLFAADRRVAGGRA